MGLVTTSVPLVVTLKSLSHPLNHLLTHALTLALSLSLLVYPGWLCCCRLRGRAANRLAGMVGTVLDHGRRTAVGNRGWWLLLKSSPQAFAPDGSFLVG